MRCVAWWPQLGSGSQGEETGRLPCRSKEYYLGKDSHSQRGGKFRHPGPDRKNTVVTVPWDRGYDI